MSAWLPNALISLFFVVFLIVDANCFEYSKTRRGPWNAWGNGNQGNSNADFDVYGMRRNINDGFPEKKSNFRQCVKPWQKPLMTIATISRPSQPVTCHPDYKPCEMPTGECQFSFSSFQYICCQDREDLKPPECPKYHTTLRTLCGGLNDASCPRSYKCLASRFDPNIEICCKPNGSMVYPEPDTSFRDNLIVPEHVQESPKTLINIQFKSLQLASGQLISNDDIEELLKQPPTVNGFQGDETKLYSLLLFGYPRNAPAFVNQPNPAVLYWLVSNLSPVNGTVYTSGSKRSLTGRETFAYVRPLIDEKPLGIHTMVLLVFEQNDEIIGKTELRVNQSSHEFVVKQWLEDFADQVNEIPVAGNFYGFSSTPSSLES